MEVLRGIASRVRRSAEISGDKDGFSTEHVLTCEVEGRAVEMTMPKMPNIHDGDEVAVAGRAKQGTLTARAYRNLRNGSSGRWSYGLDYIFIAIPAGLILVSMVFPPLIVPGLAWGVWQIVERIRTYRAYRSVMAEGNRRAQDDAQEPVASYAPPEARPLPVVPVAPMPVAAAPAPPTFVPAPIAPPAPRRPESAEQVSFPCPKCGKTLKMDRTHLGRRVRCTRKTCGTVIETSRPPG